MAHVLNRQERNYAFWKFLFFFLLSTALIVGAVYFDVRNIPAKYTEMQRDRLSRYENQEIAQQKFVKEMEDIKGLFDSLNNPGASATARDFYTSQINKKIIDLNILQDKDSSMYNRLNRNVADVYRSYLETNNISISVAQLREKLQECQLNYEKVETKLKDAEQSLQVYRQNAPSTDFR